MKTGRFSGASLAVKILLILLPVLWGLFAVWKFGVNVAWADEMRFFQNRQHFLSFEYLWAQHNEHRMLFPKLFAWLIGSIFSWNSKAFMYFSQILLFIVYFLVIRLVLDGRKVKEIGWLDAVEIVCLGLCVYNMAQHENLLWGFQVAWVMIVSFGMLSFWVFDRYLRTKKRRDLFLAMLLAVVVSYSSMHGLAVWGGYLLILLARFVFREKLPIGTCLTVGLTCLITVGLYFYKWEPVAMHSELMGKNPEQIGTYFLEMIGWSVLSAGDLCRLVGFVLAVLAACWIAKCFAEKALMTHIRVCGPMMLGLGAMAMIAMGRSSGATGQIMQSRYMTNSMLFLGMFMLVCIGVVREYESGGSIAAVFGPESDGDRIRRVAKMFTRGFAYIGVFLFICLSVLLAFRNAGMVGAMRDSQAYRTEVKKTMQNYQSLGIGDYQKIHPMTEDELDEWVAVFDRMKEERLNAFADLPE